MHNNTPPHSPFNADNDDHEDDAPALEMDDDDELIYVGDADEVLERWGAEVDNEAADDSDDDEFLAPINETDRDGSDAEDDGAAHVDDTDDDGPQRDDAVITFRKHTGSVFCGSLHPTLDLAVTGGEDDRAYVWATDTGDVVHEVTNHRDTIVAAAFSSDGNYLAIGDMAGELEVLKLSNDYKKVWEYSMGDMVWMQWHTATNVLMAGGASGEVYVWRIPSGDCKVLAGNGQQSECGTLTADGKRLIVGYADGSVRLWDIKTSTCVRCIEGAEEESSTQMAHTEAVTCIAADPENGLFLTGSQDGVVMIGCAAGATSQLRPSAGPVETLAFCTESDLKLVACGTLEGRISLWDVGKQAVRVECEKSNPSGVTRMLWAPGHNLMCSTLSGNVKVFDGRTGQLKQTLQGHRSDIYDMTYNKSKALLLTTSDDNTAKLFTSFLM